VPVDLWLRPLGDRDQAIKAWEFQEEAHQPHATGPDCGTPQGYPKNQTMQEGKTRGTWKKSHDSGMLVKPCLIHAPGLKRAAGHVERLGGLTQGVALGLPLAIRIKECSASGAIPAWMTSLIVL